MTWPGVHKQSAWLEAEKAGLLHMQKSSFRQRCGTLPIRKVAARKMSMICVQALIVANVQSSGDNAEKAV